MSKNCECGEKVVARGMCKKCYDKWYMGNKHLARKRPRKNSPKLPGKPYPIPHVVTVWECSDGREFSSETEALRYELELFRKG